ncbi:dTDP-4-dehydrorhamnose reductase [Tardiphaga sp. P9-11]|uniref:dTDP-4-dehydrorhamnose reductase n=1 Tax=Tardiphaga sp. P9-11 TaxID=2024614 RepID=UPI0011F40002|nr:dTDP-4-dehydrorhamnose reductase [Tardiphaga sp. P9-11]KAA0072953.1 dTDP-4-dehydrorhamnose reductase [Tardiphaga sp. P9-11]
MRILLTGATGQVGGALQRPLAAIGELATVDRRALDLSNPETIAAALDRLRPHLIVNPAAYTAVDLAEDEPDLAFRINSESPGVMARWAAGHDVPLVHFSTDYLFDGSGNVPWLEDSQPAPLSVYGASKLAGEEAIRDAGGRHLIVRTSWVYAAEGRNFLCTIARLARERQELRIVSDQFGAPTSAQIIADVVTSILQRELAGDLFRDSRGPINVTASGVTSWHGFATAIVAGLRRRGADLAVKDITPIQAADYPTKAIRPLNSRLDNRRLGRLFNIEAPSWQQALDVELDALMQIALSEAS